MFKNSKIDHFNLPIQKPVIKYDVVFLEKEGYKLRYALNSINPIYKDVINECEIQKVPYKIINDREQKHIWIKD